MNKDLLYLLLGIVVFVCSFFVPNGVVTILLCIASGGIIGLSIDGLT